MKIFVLRSFPSVLIGALALAGCAFGDRQVVLDYPPQNSTATGAISVARAAEMASGSGQVIVIEPFTDGRSDKRIIGEVRNGFGMRTANVVVENNVSDWVTNAVATELEAQGYDVIRSVTEENSTIPVLEGEILTVYCSAYLAYEGEVSFTARIERAGEEILDKRYTATGSVGMNWAATAESYGESLSLALANAVGNLAADLRMQML